MAFSPPNNALAWAHFRLRGGWTRSLTFTGSAMALGAVLIITSTRLNPNDGGRLLWGWATALLSVQAVCLVLYAAGRVSTAIRQDVQSKMIESHRLMPLPPAHAIAGYIIGATGPPLIFAAGTFVLGGLTAGAAGVDLRRWAFANVILLGFSVFVWVICAFSAFGAKVGAGMLFFMLVPYMTQGGVLALLPALTVLLSPVIGTSIFDLRTSGIVLPVAYAIAFAAQVYFGSILYIAATRKYRRSDAIGIDTVLGLLLVLGWVGASFAGLREWDDFRPRGWSPIKVDMVVQVIGSMVAGTLVAIAAISANAAERLRWRRHELLRDPAPMRRPIPIALVIAAATILILLIPYAPRGAAATPRLMTSLLARSGACIAIALLALYFLFDLLYASGRKAGIVIFLWLLLTWGGPIAIDMILYGLGDMGESELFAGFSTASPVGALIVLWTGGVVDTTVGILMQGLLLALPGVPWVMHRVRRGRVARVASLLGAG